MDTLHLLQVRENVKIHHLYRNISLSSFFNNLTVYGAVARSRCKED